MNNIEGTSTRTSFFPNAKPSSAKADRSERIDKAMNDPNLRSKLDLKDVGLTPDAKVDIPDSIKDFAKIKRNVDAAPVIDNSDKIARLKEQVANGSYQIDYEALADRMLESGF